MKKEVVIEQTGTQSGCWHYHNDYLVDDEIVADSSYDKNQRLHISNFKGKRLYAESPDVMKKLIQALL